MKQKKNSKKNRFSFFSFFNFRKNKKNPSSSLETEEIVPEPKGFELEISDLKRKIENFMLTRKIPQGKSLERENYRLSRTAEKLFRLEGKDSSNREYSILIATGNYLTVKEGKIIGLIELDETELNRTLQKNHKSLDSFFKESLFRLDEDSLALLDESKRKTNWKEILDWHVFFQEQLLLKLNPNIIALLLIGLDNDFKNFFMKRATKKQKKIVNDELFYLNQGASSLELSPHTKNRSLLELDSAKKEFNAVIEKIKMEIEKGKN